MPCLIMLDRRPWPTQQAPSPHCLSFQFRLEVSWAVALKEGCYQQFQVICNLLKRLILGSKRFIGLDKNHKKTKEGGYEIVFVFKFILISEVIFVFKVVFILEVVFFSPSTLFRSCSFLRLSSFLWSFSCLSISFVVCINVNVLFLFWVDNLCSSSPIWSKYLFLTHRHTHRHKQTHTHTHTHTYKLGMRTLSVSEWWTSKTLFWYQIMQMLL